MLGAISRTSSTSSSSSGPAVTSLTMAPAPRDASRAAREVIETVSPCTVIRSPPAAEDETYVGSPATDTPASASRAAMAASTAWPTSPSPTDVGAKPCATCSSRSSTRRKPLTLVIVLPTSIVRMSTLPIHFSFHLPAVKASTGLRSPG